MTYDELVDYCKEAGQTISELDYKNRILEKENQKLKKQLEETEKCLKDMFHINIENDKESEKAKTQQKEFIKYLEDKIQQQETVIAENQEKSYFLIYEDEKEDLKLYSQKAYIRRIILEEILQKYKETIGENKDE